MIFKGTISCNVCGTDNKDLQKSIIVKVSLANELRIDCDNCKLKMEKLKMEIHEITTAKQRSEFAEKFEQHWGKEI